MGYIGVITHLLTIDPNFLGHPSRLSYTSLFKEEKCRNCRKLRLRWEAPPFPSLPPRGWREAGARGGWKSREPQWLEGYFTHIFYRNPDVGYAGPKFPEFSTENAGFHTVHLLTHKKINNTNRQTSIKTENWWHLKAVDQEGSNKKNCFFFSPAPF